jgi:precorrin-2/cobalt-factor-2 C20-methyltransferase
MNTHIGTLYGIGVGPGDPDLIPVKSVKILARVPVVFAAASTKNRHSLAVSIAGPHIPESTDVRLLSFPMTVDREETREAWRSNSLAILAELRKGNDAAFLTLGDTMTYSTFGYILRNIRDIDPSVKVETIPGITSYQAAAACLNRPLVEGEESLLIVSGVNGGDRLRRISGKPENVVFMKAYRNIPDIGAALNETGAFGECVGVANCGLPNQEIIRDIGQLNGRVPSYWTLILAKQKKD